ncbi:MAG TPA: amidohydrolase, partial [Ferruginibacter sp.]|nr:amidohydrolase [Ferruginibacter sp.]
MIKERIRQLAKDHAAEFIGIRHHLHAHPELSYEEYDTSAFVQQKLQSWGIPFVVMAKTGVVGLLKGKNPGKRVVALRADMDALPITEENDIAYKSVKPGVMHACGH